MLLRSNADRKPIVLENEAPIAGIAARQGPQLGQKRKSSVRANVFRFTPNIGHAAVLRAWPVVSFIHHHCLPIGLVGRAVISLSRCGAPRSCRRGYLDSPARTDQNLQRAGRRPLGAPMLDEFEELCHARQRGRSSRLA